MCAELVIVAAADDRLGVGKGGAIPWRLPHDLQRFRALTLGGVLVMGRLTYESLGGPLKGRQGVVLSSRRGFDEIEWGWRFCDASLPGIFEAHRKVAAEDGREKVGPLFAVGGARVWDEALAVARLGAKTAVMLTRVEGDFGCDAFFPYDPTRLGFRRVSETAWQEDSGGGPRSRFVVLSNF